MRTLEAWNDIRGSALGTAKETYSRRILDLASAEGVDAVVDYCGLKSREVGWDVIGRASRRLGVPEGLAQRRAEAKAEALTQAQRANLARGLAVAREVERVAADGGWMAVAAHWDISRRGARHKIEYARQRLKRHAEEGV